jgi:hypothetical protein
MTIYIMNSLKIFLGSYQTLERLDQDHLLKKDQIKIIFFWPQIEGQNFKTDKKSTLNFWTFEIT